MHDANPVCAFSGGQARSSVLGVRPSASIRLRCRVPGPRCQIAGTRYLVPGTGHQAECPSPASKNPHTGMQDRKGSDSGYLVPGTWYLTPVSHSHISNLNKAVGLTVHILMWDELLLLRYYQPPRG
jgi:hypothetical protein